MDDNIMIIIIIREYKALCLKRIMKIQIYKWMFKEFGLGREK